MPQTFNVTSCRSCPLFEVERGLVDDGDEMPDEYTCKHPQGGVVADMWRAVLDNTIPLGCPLKTNMLLVRLCPSTGVGV